VQACKYDLFTVIKNTGVQWFTDCQQLFVTSACSGLCHYFAYTS